jgi:hypothetical protein
VLLKTGGRRWWSNQLKQVVCVVVSGRDDPEFANVIGFMSDVVLLEVQLSERDLFRQFAARVFAKFCTAYERRSHWELALNATAKFEQMARVTFNWLSVMPDELAGCPGPRASEWVKDLIRIEPFPFDSPNRLLEFGASNPFAIGFTRIFPGIAITGTLTCNSYVFSLNDASQFLEDLRFVAKKFHSDPESPVHATLAELGQRSQESSRFR